MLRLASIALLVSFPAIAAADGELAPAPAPPPAVAPAPPPPAGPRFRNGFSLSAGEEVGSGPSSGLTGQLYGADWRIGAQMTDALAFYLHSHLSFGTAHIGSTSGVTGNFASAVVCEYTLPVRAFLGVGLGYGVLNNPSGPLGEARVGWYPFEAAPGVTSRRFNIAFDARLYFAGDQIGTVTQLALSIGYDRF